jgi:hypothetical protein
MACNLTENADAESLMCNLGVNDRMVISTDITNFLLKQRAVNEFSELTAVMKCSLKISIPDVLRLL